MFQVSTVSLIVSPGVSAVLTANAVAFRHVLGSAVARVRVPFSSVTVWLLLLLNAQLRSVLHVFKSANSVFFLVSLDTVLNVTFPFDLESHTQHES